MELSLRLLHLQRPERPETPWVWHRHLAFEPEAQPTDQRKHSLYTQKESMYRLRKEKYARHALPWEINALLIDCLDGKLNASQVAVAENIGIGGKHDHANPNGEWLDLAYCNHGETLSFYEHPLLVFDNEKQKYAIPSYKKIRDFKLNGLAPNEELGVKDVASKSPDMVRYLWGRPYEQLPSELQHEALMIPPQDVPFPVGRGMRPFRWVIGGPGNRLSRGVRVSSRKPEYFGLTPP